MVNTDELMRGNYVQYETDSNYLQYKIDPVKKYKICRVSEIKVIEVRVELLENGAFTTLLGRELEPIPITEEILEKCGFDKHDISEYVSKNTYSNLQDNKIYEQFDDNGESLFSLVGVDRHFRYLHELQNIYFIYRKKQLEINL